MARCTATNRQGRQCGQQAVTGTTVCHYHGAKAPRARTIARRRIEAEQARQAVSRLNLDTGTGKIDPRDALELELWRTHIQVLLYQALVDDLSLEEGGIYGRTYHATGRPTGEGKPHVLVEMRDRERQHLAQVAVHASKAGVEERRLRLEEERGRIVADVFRAVFNDPELGLEPDRRSQAMSVAGRHLRLLAETS